MILSLRTRLARFAFERGGLLGLAALVLYMTAATRHAVDGEDSHFATLGALGGAAHPSGYPLFVLWLRATSWLPGDSPAHTAALATALLAAASVLALHAACRAWGAKSASATLAVALFAGAPIVIALATEAEVFAPNDLVVALVLWLAAARGPLRGPARCGVLGLVAGLGLANHLTCALVAPIGIYGLVLGLREGRARLGALLAAGGLVVGLAPYAYLLVAPTHAASWGTITSLHDVLDTILRRDYGGPAEFDHVESVPALVSIGALLATLARTWLWLPLVVGLVNLGLRIWRPAADGPTRWAWSLLAASFVLAGPLLASRFDVPPEGVGMYVVRRFHVLPALLLAVPIADAFDRTLSRVKLRAPPIVAMVGVLVFGTVALLAWPWVARAHAPAVEVEAINVLESLPEHAVLVGIDDDLGGGVPYAQLALGIRRDVLYVQWPMLALPWYRARVVAAGLPDAADPIGALLAQDRYVFVQPGLRDITHAFPSYPFGVVVRVMPRTASPPPIQDLFDLQRQIYASYTVPYPVPHVDDEWPAAVHEKYAASWRVMARALDSAGRHDDAAWCLDQAQAIGPQP